MDGIYDLKEMLCKELEEYGKKGDLSAGTLDIVDKLAHAVKNLDKIIEADEGGSYYSGESYEGRSMRGGSYGGGSYERGGRSNRGSYRGSYARGRYSREGYSRKGEIAEQLRDLMEEAPDEKTRQEIQKLVMKMEQM